MIDQEAYDELFDDAAERASYTPELLNRLMAIENHGMPTGANAFGTVGKMKRGDVVMRLNLVVENDVIVNAGFSADGCAATIASASVAAELVVGKPVDEAVSLSVADIERVLGPLGSANAHCGIFAVEAVRAAVGDWMLRTGRSPADAGVACEHGSIPCLMAERCSLRSSLLAVSLDLGEVDGPSPNDSAEEAAYEKVEAAIEDIRQASKRARLREFDPQENKTLLVALRGELEVDEELADICELEGSSRCYFYSKRSMTSSYANLSFLAAEDDARQTVATLARFESETYPRPIAATSIAAAPVGLSTDDVLDAYEALVEDPAYADIKKTVASNGDAYFYSDRFLAEPLARSLAEWEAVEQDAYV